jgi:glycosyltransferase involved in cell wall biosynthesis
MRIGIDARELAGRVTGVGRYLSGLLSEWAATGAASRHEFVLYAHAPISSVPAPFETRVLPGATGTWWQQIVLPAAARKDRLDVFLAPQYSAPLLLNVPTVVVIYDVSFAAHPEWFRVREGLRLRTLARSSARRACAVVTISDFSFREIHEHLGVSDRRIHIIPPGVPVRAASAPSPRREPKLLYVGSIFNRRNIPALVSAFASVARARPDATLDIVGDNRTYPFEDIAALVERQNLGTRITWHAYASDDVLAGLYQHSRAFAFLSEYEGLGMTPLEALTAGAPSVLYDTPIARETCGHAALFVKRGDGAALRDGIERLLYDDATRAALLSSAPAALAKYDWARAAADMLSVLERCR